MNIVDVINNITNFSSNIWQTHPFREGNTRTTALFIEKYLVSLGYDVDNTMFKEKSVYFRNALVRSNYFNNYLNIEEDKYELIDNSDDESGDNYREALNQIERFRRMIKNKYRDFLIQEEIE